jgi:hypothetical protein
VAVLSIGQIMAGLRRLTNAARGRRTTHRGRRGRLESEAQAGFDRFIELDLEHVANDGSLHKAPYGGELTGPNPTDRSKIDWKWSVAAERHGVPVGWTIAAANHNDITLLMPTLDAVADRGLITDITTLHLDRSYDDPVVERQLAGLGLTDLDIQRRSTKVPGVKRQPLRLGMRLIVETTNTWWSNYGQLRRNTDRRARHRHAALCLATTILIIGKLLTYRDRWSPPKHPSAQVLTRDPLRLGEWRSLAVESRRYWQPRSLWHQQLPLAGLRTAGMTPAAAQRVLRRSVTSPLGRTAQPRGPAICCSSTGASSTEHSTEESSLGPTRRRWWTQAPATHDRYPSRPSLDL